MKVKKFDRATLKVIEPELKTALAKFGKKFGINIEPAGCTFSSENATWKIGLSVITKNGTVKTRERNMLEAIYPQYADKEVTLRLRGVVRTGKVVGYRPRRSRFPFDVEMEDGKIYGIEEQVIERQLGASGNPL